MFAAYRPALRSNGNSEGQRTVNVQAEPLKKPEDLAPITSKEDKPATAFVPQISLPEFAGERP